MKYDCVILYGNSLMVVSKYAGTFRIATELRNHGYRVQCIDISLFSFPQDAEKFKSILAGFVSDETLWLGISNTFLNNLFGIAHQPSKKLYEEYFEKNPEVDLCFKNVLEFTKELNPSIKFIVGGANQMWLDRYGFKTFRGYSDTEIVEYTNWVSGKSKKINLEFYNNTINGKEFLEFNKSSIVYQNNDIIDREDALPIEVSRGCIFKCKFCSYPLNGKTKGEWIKDSRVLLDEFRRNYEQFGVTRYMFADDTYNDSVDKLKRFHDEVFSKLDFKISYSTYLRLDLLMRFPETIDYLVESGLVSAQFGIETINPKSAKVIGKGVNPRDQLEFLKSIKETKFKNISVRSGFILGLPYDTADTCQEFEEFIFSDENPLDFWTIYPLYIRPKEIAKSLLYFSEFDLNYEKYGYEIYTTPRLSWKNNVSGLNFEYCLELADGINKKSFSSDRFKIGGFAVSYYQSLGLSLEDLQTLSCKEITKKYNLKDLIRQKKERYLQQLSTYGNNNGNQ